MNAGKAILALAFVGTAVGILALTSRPSFGADGKDALYLFTWRPVGAATFEWEVRDGESKDATTLFKRAGRLGIQLYPQRQQAIDAGMAAINNAGTYKDRTVIFRRGKPA
jgi:hypothetical protein